ncbi:MAG: hypothetical protein K2Y05_05965 [Hyphomicrobiaceae bacterium]|nr:hypothetical protein [Hyphomicrobiaceae bacterium]
MDIEADVKDLRRQVVDLEGAISALSGQIGQISADMRGICQPTRERVEAINTSIGQMVARLDTLNTQVWSLRDDLPLIVQSAVAGALPAAPKRRLD